MSDTQPGRHADPRPAAPLPTSTHPLARAGAPALALAGLLFAAYPALRPYHDETTLAGAAGMASGAWVAAHVFGMIAFLLLSLGLAARAVSPGRHRTGVAAAVLSWLGAGLVLPYYGAETFGLHAVAARAVAEQDATLLALADAFRFAPVPMIFFGIGLLCLAAAGVCVAVTTWRVGGLARIAGLTLGIGLVLYLPQFFGTPPMRIGHGVLLLLGCVLVSLEAPQVRTEATPAVNPVGPPAASTGR